MFLCRILPPHHLRGHGRGRDGDDGHGRDDAHAHARHDHGDVRAHRVPHRVRHDRPLGVLPQSLESNLLMKRPY